MFEIPKYEQEITEKRFRTGICSCESFIISSGFLNFAPMKNCALFRVWAPCAFFILSIVATAACGGPNNGADAECRQLRERLDEAVRLQFDADSCDAAMIIYSDVAASYRADMPLCAKELVVEGLNRMWYVYYFMLFDYADAMDCLERGLEICETDSVEASRLYLNKGVTYSQLAIRCAEPSEMIFGLADMNLREAHRRAVTSRNVNVADYSLLNMIVLYDKVSHPVAGLDSVLSQTVSLHCGNEDAEVAFSKTLFDIVRSFQDNDYESIIEDVDRLLGAVRFEPDEIRNKYQLMLYKARALTAVGRPKEALSVLDSVRYEAASAGMSDVMMPVFELEAKAYAAAGNEKEALRRRLAYYELRDARLSEENLMVINELPLIYDIRRYQDSLALENHKRRQISIYAVNITLVVVLLILFSCIVVKKNRKLRTANEVLYRSNEEKLRLFGNGIAATADRNAVEGDRQPHVENSDELHRIFDNAVERIERSRLWCDSSLTISRLAVDMGVGEKSLSKAVNTYANMNFSAFINRYRVMDASKMLGDAASFGRLSLQGIAESVGFKSRTSFIASFKQFVGMLPSEYRKIAEGKPHKSL